MSIAADSQKSSWLLQETHMTSMGTEDARLWLICLRRW